MKKSLFLILSIIITASVLSQNNITVSVMVNPPYSHDIRDYVNQPGKILVLLTASASDDLSLGKDRYTIKLIGSITGDNGISLRTKASYRPPMPIELLLGQSMQLTANDIEQYFTVENLDIQGISREDLLAGKGLREGSYSICVQAVDYDTNEPYSEEDPFGCSSPFDLRYIEPPQLLFPMCEEVLEPLYPQNLNFQWTMPVGITNPGLLRYKFRLFELPDQASNPEAIVNSAMPPFFEQSDIPTTMLIYNIAMPALDTEKSYAWQVVAEDINEKIQFANQGKSEICTFSFQEAEKEQDGEQIVITWPANCSSDSALTSGNVTDFYLSWMFSSLIPPNIDNLSGQTVSIDLEDFIEILKKYENAAFKLSFYSDKNANNLKFSTSGTKYYFQAKTASPNFPFVDGQSYWFQVSLIDSITNNEYLKSELCAFKYTKMVEQGEEYVSKTIQGNLRYQFETEVTKTYPVANANLKLVKKYLLKDASSGKDIEIPEDEYINSANSKHKENQTTTFANKSFNGLASCTSNQNGNFSFTLNWPKDEKLGLIENQFKYTDNGKTHLGTLSRVLRIEAVNNYYAPVNQNITPVEEITNLGSLTNYVYSYTLQAEITEGYQGISNLSKAIVNKNVYLFRKVKDSDIPYFEGDIKVQNQMMAIPAAMASKNYKLIAKQKSIASKDAENKDVGFVKFTSLVQNFVNNDEYYLWIEGTPIQTAQAVRYKAANIPANNSQSGYNVQLLVTSDTENQPAAYSEIKDFSFTVKDRFIAVSANPPKSGIKGKLVYTYPGKNTTIRPLANTAISIISCYVTGPEGNSKIVKLPNKYEEASEAFFGAKVLGTSTTNANGEFDFEFTNIPVQSFFSNIGEFEVSTGQLNNTQTWQAWESNKETDFRIKYEKKHGNIRKVFRIVVEDPNGLYMSPIDNFTIEPLQTKDVGLLTSDVFTYQLTGSVYKNWGTLEEVNPGYAYKIPGAECYLLRKKSETAHLNLPEGEGENIMGSLKEYPDYEVISFDTTGTNGEFEFDNILFRNTNAAIYRYYRTPEMKGTENYEPLFVGQETINPFTKPRFFFNNDYQYAAISGASVYLLPAKPGIRGKVISNVNAQSGIKFAKCKLYVMRNGLPPLVFEALTDFYGYFDLSNQLNEITDLSVIKEIYLSVSKDGFYYNENGEHKTAWIKKYGKDLIQEGRQIVEDNIILNANGGLKGRVINEKGEAVDAYVRFDENRIFGGYVGEGELTPTWSSIKGAFNIPAIPGNNRKLIVIPKDVAYFEDTILVNVKEGASTLVENIVVKERSHRIWFYVKKQIGNGPINQIVSCPGARVKLLGDDNSPVAVANSLGRVDLNFKNVSVNNLSFQVSGPIGSNYVPKIISFKNEESKTPVKFDDVILKPGLSVHGIVKLDGKPTKEALVYIDLQKGSDTELTISDDGSSSSESQYFYQTSPKVDGSFELTCLPPELKGKKITVKAVYQQSRPFNKSGTGNTNSHTENNSNTHNAENKSGDEQATTIIGDSKEYSVGNNLTGLQLNMKSYANMQINNLWGFPLEITDLQEISSIKVQVSGRVKLQGYSKGFDPLGSQTFEVFAVPFAATGEKTGKVQIAQPENNKVIISSKREAKLKYANSYNVKLCTKPNEGLFVIEKLNNTGVLQAFAEIVDNSFQYPSSYLNFEGTQFYLAKVQATSNSGTSQSSSGNVSIQQSSTISQAVSTSQITNVQAVVDIFNASQPGDGNDIRRFGLCNVANKNAALGSNLHFKFINFEATANASTSYLEGEKITLDATLTANIQNAGQVSINMGNLVLKNNTIDPVSGTKPILITLQDGASVYSANAKPWQIEAFDWKIDPQQGGLVSKNCMLHTGKIDLPVKEFNLRSDFAYVGDVELQGINLGGYPILVNASEATFGYNQHTGSDKNGHWQLIIFPNGTGQAPGKVYGLPHLSGVLELETISLLSNGEDVFGIGPGASGMKLYNTVAFKPLLLNTIPDGFVLSGGVDFAIPNVQQGLGTRLTFSKYRGANKLVVDPIDISFEGVGKVQFKPNLSMYNGKTSQEFFENEQKFTAYGTVEEPGLLEPIQVFLTHFAKTKITTVVNSSLAPSQKIKIGEDLTYFSNITCAMDANATKWNYLTFSGDLDGFGENGIEANKRRLNFTVFGEIKASNQTIKANSIETPFGNLDITYEKGRLLGSLAMNNFPLGPALVTGTANMLMDNDGWAFYSSAMAKNVPVPEPATVNAGILIGNYKTITPDMKNTVLTYAIRKEMPAAFTDNGGLKGFYLIGGRDLPIKGLDIDVNVVVAKAYVEVPMAGVDASFYMNFAGGKKTIGGRLDGGLQILFSLGSIACTDLSGDAKATISIGANYENKKVSLKGESTFSSSLTISQGVGAMGKCIDAVSFGVDVEGGIIFTSPFNVDFKLYKPTW